MPANLPSTPPNSSSQERERDDEHVRREGRITAKVEVLVVRGRRTVSLETSDVSFKGLFLRTEEPPPVRSLVRLRVKLPHGDIEAHAMAVHVADPANPATRSRPGVGVQFWGLAGPDRMAWEGFIKELLQNKRAADKAAAVALAAANAKDVGPISDTVPTMNGTRVATGEIRIAPIVDIPHLPRNVG